MLLEGLLEARNLIAHVLGSLAEMVRICDAHSTFGGYNKSTETIQISKGGYITPKSLIVLERLGEPIPTKGETL